MSGSLLAFFHLCLISVLFSGASFFRSILSFCQVHPYWNEVFQKLFRWFLFFFRSFLNHLPNKRRMCLLCWRQTLFALVANAGDKCIENAHSYFNPVQLHITSDVQTELFFRLLFTDTHLRKRAVTITLLYSPPCMLYPHVIYAIAFSAGLNGLQVD